MTDEVERALRDALAARAEDMAPGDGAAWDPYRPRSRVVDLAAQPEARRWPNWRTLAAAVAAIALPVAGGAFLLAHEAEDTTRPPADPTCTPASTTTTTTTTTVAVSSEPTVAVSVPPSTTTTVPATLAPVVASTTTTASDPCAPTTTEVAPLPRECVGMPWVVVIGDEPTDARVGASGQLQVSALEVTEAAGLSIADGTERVVEAGPYTGRLTTAPRGITAIEIQFDDAVFVAEGVDVSEPELVALAATVEERTPDSFAFTPPCNALPAATTAPSPPGG